MHFVIRCLIKAPRFIEILCKLANKKATNKSKVSRKHYTNCLNSMVLGLKAEFCGLTITQTAYLPTGVPDS